MKLFYLIFLLVFGITTAANSQNELPNYKTYLNSLLTSDDPDKVAEGNYLKLYFNDLVPSLYISLDGSKVFDGDAPLRIVTRGYRTNDIPNFSDRIEHVTILVINLKMFSDHSNFQISQAVMDALPNLKYVVFLGEYEYTNGSVLANLPTNRGNVIFLQLKSLPS